MNTTPEATRLTTALWHVTPLVTGAVIMVLELVAFRLYAPYFGYSIYVWGSMISVVMAALAAGYGVGGWLADRSRTDRTLYLVVLLSGVYQLVITLTVNSFLPSLARLNGTVGTVLATLIIFGFPVAALASVAPFVIRLQARAAHVGITAGKIYALATVGSIGGVVLTSFYLVPRLGTRATLIAACAATFAVGVAGLVAGARRGRGALLALLPALALLAFAPEARWPRGTIWLSESEYNQVRVVRRDERLALVLNHNTVHTLRDVRTGWAEGGYYDYFALGPALLEAEPRRLLVLGMGAGGSLAATRAAAPHVEADAVEIDPQVVEAGERFFGLRRDDARLRVHVADARPWLSRSEGVYELVHVDIYQGGPYVPFYLVTVEFFQSVRAHMAEGGLLMINVMDTGRNREVLNSTAATLRRVFPSVLYTEPSRGNFLLFVFARERTAEDVRGRLERVGSGDIIEQLARKAASSVAELTPPAGTPFFTDDHSPIEEMTRRMSKTRIAQ